MKYLPAAILFGATVDLLCMWFRRFDIDYPEGCEPPERWIAWGTCRSLSGAHDFRYFLLRLPSYQWGYDAFRDRQAWTRLTLVRFAGHWKHSGYWVVA